MNFRVVIPARFASTRLPGKPLLEIAGKPMIQHVYERALESNATDVLIATDDERIADAVRKFGAPVCMTSVNHPSGTDRIQEVASRLGLQGSDIVVNVQGDEPLIPPAVINQVAENLITRSDAGIATLCELISNPSEIANQNAVKVVFDCRGLALYFSRSTIPSMASVDAANCYRHIGIYAYRVSTLNQFVTWPPAMLETQERLEQLRALYHGTAIHVDVCKERIPAGVDTPEDLEAVRRLYSSQ